MDERVADLEDALNEALERLDDHGERIEFLEGQMDSAARGKHSKFAKIIDAADNKRSRGQDEVAVTASDIKTATGVSTRYCYELLEEMGEAVPFCSVLEEEEVTGRKNKPKRLVIDFDGRDAGKLKQIVRGSQNQAEGE